METAVIKRSHRLKFLEVGHYLALHFDTGYACFQVTGRRLTRLKPFSLGSIVAGDNLSTWNSIQDVNNSDTRMLTPYDENLIYHYFWGVSPAQVRIYTQYPPNKYMGNMENVDLSISGDIGYTDGIESPYEGPYSEDTELFTVYQLWAQYQAYNPTADNILNVKMSFDQAQYQYNLITDPTMIKRLLVGDLSTKIKKFDMGPSYPDNASAPSWLKKLLLTKDGDLLKISNSMVESY